MPARRSRAAAVPGSVGLPVLRRHAPGRVPAAPVLAGFLRPGDDGDGGPRAVSPDLPEGVVSLAARDGATGEAGQVHAVAQPPGAPWDVVLLAGLGAGPDARAWRRAGAALARRAARFPRVTVSVPASVDADALRALGEGLLLGSYGFSLKSDPKRRALSGIDVVTDAAGAAEALRLAGVTARAVAYARDLINTPGLTKSPDWLARQAVALAGRAGLDVEVLDERRLAAEGFGGLLGVGAGSSRPPRLIRLGYAPEGGAAGGHLVLVGKGITFDSGGLSLKPPDGMITMKTDMSGGAAVLATMGALAEMGVGFRVTGLVPAAENMPGGSALRPGDVIRHWGGRTVEVLNTDAEGRLVLADALAYAAANLRPDAVVDLATLTGAMSLALGRRAAGFFATDDALADALIASSGDAGERLWRMPLVEDYRAALDSDVADLTNIGTGKVSGGAITAALFLREFVGGLPWAHLDIAGPARSDRDDAEISKGGTGYGVRTLLRLVETWTPPAPVRRPPARRRATTRRR